MSRVFTVRSNHCPNLPTTMKILHLTRTMPAIIPLYVSRFSCIGSACEDTCCSGWRVAIDKKTFIAYRQTKHPGLVDLFAKNIKRERSNNSDANYAKVELDPVTRACPMMVDRLCAVHANLGESYLSDTCFSYPRSSRNFGGQHEQALMLSCPEAARQALLAEDAFDFVEGKITVRGVTVKDSTNAPRSQVETMGDVRNFCLHLMRAEGLSLPQRLAILGVFCEQLTSVLHADGYAGVPALLDSFVTMVESGQVLEALSGMQPNYPVQAMFFSTLWQRDIGPSRSLVFNKVVQAVAHGLGANPETGKVTSEHLVERYIRGMERLPAALTATPHLLDHYLLNELFIDLFPFQGTTPYDHYLQLVTRFGLLRLMLAAQCSTEGELPDVAALLQTVQICCKRFQHDKNFAAQVQQALKNSGWSKLEKVFELL
jgi:lysine-N-methylase